MRHAWRQMGMTFCSSLLIHSSSTRIMSTTNIPSARETAAWLSLWDRDVAREVAQREPWVLLTAGDPGSLSPETRRAVLTELARRMVAENHLLPVLDPDSLKRFAAPEEIASLVAYIASPLAAATTGAALRADGGVIKSAF